MSLQTVTHQTHHPVKRLADCHTGCGRAGVPTMLLNEFKTRAEPRRDDYENRFSFVAVCIMVGFFISACCLDIYLTEPCFL